ncbi:MAG: amidohydrolase family protein [Acidaminococcaceae bacterium]|nr:amidohydrolase family protein [Acidaminococcaceae bacterium]
MKIIDAHMHYFNIEGFDELAKLADHENSRKGWQDICEANGIVFSVAMGNSDDAPCRFGGVVPRLINLGGEPFCETPYNQPDNVGYCLGVDSEAITPENAEKTAQEFEYYLQRDPHCVGIKFYMGYQNVYLYDARHEPLFELAKAYDVPVAMHSGETANHHGRLRYAHPLTVDEAASEHPDVRFVICHVGNPWIPDAIEVASKNENVFIDFSGLWEHRLTPKREREIAAFRQYVRMWLEYHELWDKIMYGSDWPLVNIPDNIRNLGKIVPEEHWNEFYYENALRVYSRIQKLVQ